MKQFDFYLAGPFFTPTQKETMATVKSWLIGELGFTVADPQELGPVIVDMKPEERGPEVFKGIFTGNIDGMNLSRWILACIDDRDTGTAFEIGYGFCASIPIVTFSANGYGANVMLSQATVHHCKNLVELKQYLDQVKAMRTIAPIQRDFAESIE